VTHHSMEAMRLGSAPPGPQANDTWRFFSVTRVHAFGKAKAGLRTHQTFSPEGSTSLNSRFSGGQSPRTSKVIS